MTIQKPRLATAAWVGVAGGAFALGWLMKPAGQADGDASAGNSRNGRALPAATAATVHGGRHGGRQLTSDAVDPSAQAHIAGAALTSARIAELGREFRSATDPIVQREVFAKLLAGLTAENALQIREQIAHLDSNDPAFHDFHFAWGKIGGAEAVLHGTGTDKLDMGPTMAGWASADPAAARAWFASLKETGRRNRGHNSNLKEGLVHGLATNDPGQAAEFVFALGGAGDPRAKDMMSIVTGKVLQTGGAAGMARWAEALPPGDLRGHALYEAARARVREDPAAAAAWATPLAGDKNGSAVVYGISSEWASRDGAAAVRWLDSLSGNQSDAYGPTLAGWAKRDPLAASQHLAAMPPSENRDHAIGGLVSTHRWEDPSAAIAWAGEIRDAKRRSEILALAAEAYLRRDRPTATAWLPNSGLSAETQQRLLGGK
jgi:hypothetical protein